MLLAPLPASEVIQPKKLWEKLARQGFVRVRVGGEVVEIEDKPDIPDGTTVDIVIDRLVVRPDARTRLVESVTVALRWSGGKQLALGVGANAGGLGGGEIYHTLHESGNGFPHASPNAETFLLQQSPRSLRTLSGLGCGDACRSGTAGS